jgi:hypothetical protein
MSHIELNYSNQIVCTSQFSQEKYFQFIELAQQTMLRLKELPSAIETPTVVDQFDVQRAMQLFSETHQYLDQAKKYFVKIACSEHTTTPSSSKAVATGEEQTADVPLSTIDGLSNVDSPNIEPKPLFVSPPDLGRKNSRRRSKRAGSSAAHSDADIDTDAHSDAEPLRDTTLSQGTDEVSQPLPERSSKNSFRSFLGLRSRSARAVLTSTKSQDSTARVVSDPEYSANATKLSSIPPVPALPESLQQISRQTSLKRSVTERMPHLTLRTTKSLDTLRLFSKQQARADIAVDTGVESPLLTYASPLRRPTFMRANSHAETILAASDSSSGDEDDEIIMPRVVPRRRRTDDARGNLEHHKPKDLPVPPKFGWAVKLEDTRPQEDKHADDGENTSENVDLNELKVEPSTPVEEPSTKPPPSPTSEEKRPLLEVPLTKRCVSASHTLSRRQDIILPPAELSLAQHTIHSQLFSSKEHDDSVSVTLALPISTYSSPEPSAIDSPPARGTQGVMFIEVSADFLPRVFCDPDDLVPARTTDGLALSSSSSNPTRPPDRVPMIPRSPLLGAHTRLAKLLEKQIAVLRRLQSLTPETLWREEHKSVANGTDATAGTPTASDMAKFKLHLVENQQQTIAHTRAGMNRVATLVQVAASTQDIRTFPYRLVAYQLTLLDAALFKHIPAEAVLSHSARTPNPRIQASIDFFNYVTRLVEHSILSLDEAAARGAVLHRWIKIAKALRDLRSYQMLLAVVGGLRTPPIRRLKRTWAQAAKRDMSRLDRLQQLVSPDNNYERYRELISKAGADTCLIPCLSVFLFDATYLVTACKSSNTPPLEDPRVQELLASLRRYQESCKYSAIPAPWITKQRARHRQTFFGSLCSTTLSRHSECFGDATTQSNHYTLTIVTITTTN